MDAKQNFIITQRLTKKERELFDYLNTENRHFSRKEILKTVWSGADCIEAFRKVIYNIRNKLGPQSITYTKGKGYAISIENVECRV